MVEYNILTVSLPEQEFMGELHVPCLLNPSKECPWNCENHDRAVGVKAKLINHLTETMGRIPTEAEIINECKKVDKVLLGLMGSFTPIADSCPNAVIKSVVVGP